MIQRLSFCIMMTVCSVMMSGEGCGCGCGDGEWERI